MYADFIYMYMWLYMGRTVDINYVDYNYLCDISFTHIIA